MTVLRDHLRRFREMPRGSKLLWIALWAGTAFLVAGYWNRSPWQGCTGLALVFAVFSFAAIGSWARPDPVNSFAGGLFVSVLIGLPILGLFLAIGAAAYLVIGALHGFSWASAIRLLHFTAVLTGVSCLLSLPRAIQAVTGKSERAGE